MKINLHPYGHECAPGGLDCGTFSEAIWGVLDDEPVTFAVGARPFTHLMIRVNGHLTDEEFRAAKQYTATIVERGPQHYFPVVFATERLIYPISLGEDASDVALAIFGKIPGLGANETIILVNVVDALQQPRQA